MSLVWIWGQRYLVCDQCAVAIQGFPLGYPPPIIPTLLKMWTGEALAPHFHQLTTLSIVIPTKSLLVQRQSPVSQWIIYFHQRLQIQFRFDPTKHFRATENPICTPYFSKQPMPTHKKARWWTPCHWTRRLSRMVGSSIVALSTLNLRRLISLYPSLYLVVFRL